MPEFHILSENVDGVEVHTKTLPDGTPLEELGDVGYRSIVLRVLGEASDEGLEEFYRAVGKELAAGNRLRLEYEENDQMRLRFNALVSSYEGAKYTTVADFVATHYLAASVDSSKPFK